ncbi:hypothetical protein [Geminisphaera colitermitum]|uniref:hypothetical protein n=1 Tax=Geminisphaera colitermitum TaxID=1148786 RepID=UPI000158D1DA|nr:hypothetical protein [Geminisphaera colitermitum]
MKTTILHLALASLAAIVWLPDTARAALLAHDNFDSYTLAESLKTQDGGTGWKGAWDSQVATTSIADKLLTYTLGDFTYGGGKSLAVSGANATSAGTRDITSVVTNGADVYVSMLFQVVQANNADGTITANHFTSWSPRDGTFTAASDNTLLLGSSTKAGARVNNQNKTITTDLQYNTTYLVVVRFSGWAEDAGGGNFSYKTTTTWLNPTAADLTSTDSSIVATITSTAGGSTAFNGLQLRTNSLSTDTYYFDDIRIGTTWNDVVLSTVPEPATHALILALGALATIIALRHRNT